MSKIVAYCRFSDRPGADTCLSNELQIDTIRKWADDNCHEIVAEHFDAAVSGAEDDEMKRPGIYDAIADLRPGYILVSEKLDRIARKVPTLVLFEREIKRKRARLFTVKESAHFDNPEAKLMYRMLAAFAEYEREMIAERTRARQRAKQKLGMSVSHVPPYGWSKVQKNGQWLLFEDPEEQKVLQEIDLRVVHGDQSMLGLMNEFNERGVLQRNGKPWKYQNFYRIISRLKNKENPDPEQMPEIRVANDKGGDPVGDLL